jgi:hypothetical protein
LHVARGQRGRECERSDGELQIATGHVDSS